MSQYFVTQKGETVGPWPIDKVHEGLKSGHLLLSDYIYDPKAQEWQPLLTSNLIDEKFKMVVRPEAKADKPSFSEPHWDKQEWFVFRDNKQQGPFTYLEIVRMLQNKKMHDYDFVWSSSLDTWTKVFECHAFSQDQIKKLAKHPELQNQAVFFRRQFMRVSYEVPLFVHNQKKLWKAMTHEISGGGCAFSLESNELEPGDRIIVHFTPGKGQSVPAFNALCSIASKNPDSKGGKWTRYGVKFEALNQDIQITIRSFADRAA